jgi:hypothetical protein
VSAPAVRAMDAGNGATGREPTPLGDLLANPNAARIYDYWLGARTISPPTARSPLRWRRFSLSW